MLPLDDLSEWRTTGPPWVCEVCLRPIPQPSALLGVVIAETYPAEAYRLVGAEFSRGESKRRMAERCRKAEAIFAWAAAHGVCLAPGAQQAILDGFGPLSAGEDAFDALMGLVKMIEVADGRRPEATEVQDRSRAWEGWILAR